MSKVYLVDRYRGSVLSKALVADGQLLEFSMTGVFVAERPMEFNLPYMREVDAVSFLLQNGEVEMATNIDGVFTKSFIGASIMNITKRMKSIAPNKLLFAGVRNGDVDNQKYTQYIYIFDKGLINNDLLKGVLENG